MLRWRLRVLLTLILMLLIAAGVTPVWAQTTTPGTTTVPTGEDSTTSVPSDVGPTTTDEPECPDADTITIVAVFSGEPTGSENDILFFDEIDLESGTVIAPVEVEYPDGLPLFEDVGPLRVRATESETGLRSEVQCGGTTTIDDEFVEADDDRLAAIARTAGDLSQRAGRWALIASLVVFAVVVTSTVYRRWRPRLW